MYMVLYYYRPTENSVTSSTWKSDADIVLRNMPVQQEQIKTFELACCQRAFDEYCAMVSYNVALHLDKHFDKINDAAKANMKKYIRIMWAQMWRMICSKNMPAKQKVLYVMVATRTLRPLYALVGKK